MVHVPEQNGAPPDFRANLEKRVGVLESMVCSIRSSVGETGGVVRHHEHEPLPHPWILEKSSKCVELLLREPAARTPRNPMGHGTVDRDRDGLWTQPSDEGPGSIDCGFRRVTL